MGLGQLLWMQLWRRPARTAFTAVSLAGGFLVFALLQGVSSAFGDALDRTDTDRLLVEPRFAASMPLAFADSIERVAGVIQLAWTNRVPMYFRDPQHALLVVATSPKRFFGVRDELKLPAVDIEKLTHTPMGLIALDSLARRFGWKVGDRVRLVSPIEREDGTRAWTFELVGVMSDPQHPGQFPFAVANYDDFDTARVADKGAVGRFVVRVADPRLATDVAHRVDRLFAGSPTPTLTQLDTERATHNRISSGELRALADAGTLVVCIAMLLLAGRVLLRSVRERTPDIAKLKVLGRWHARVLSLVGLEALALCLGGALAGLALAAASFPSVSESLSPMGSGMGHSGLPVRVVLEGLAAAAGLALAAASIPAWRALRLDAVEASHMKRKGA